MNTATAAAFLASLGTASLTDIAEANDWAVNTVRDYCGERDYNAAALVAEESRRIRVEGLDLAGYIKARRVGSYFRITRVVRLAIFVAIATRRQVVARFGG